jgi:hypothetical protein
LQLGVVIKKKILNFKYIYINIYIYIYIYICPKTFTQHHEFDKYLHIYI